MEIEPLGAIVLVVGVVTLLADYRWVLRVLFALTMLAAAGAVSLPVLGGATITPPHLFSVFLILKALANKNGLSSTFGIISLREPGGWLAFMVCYGILAAVIAPGLFPDTLVYAFNRFENGMALRLEPLIFGSGQITQGVYAIGSVLTFSAGVILLRRPDAFRYVFQGFVACTLINLLFAILDVASYYMGNADLLSFIRTGGYAQLYSHVEEGVKRIVGSFPEASSFASYSSILLGFWTSLWMQHYRERVSGPLMLFTLVALLLSTSSTAYVTIATLFTLFVGKEVVNALLKRNPQRIAVIVCALTILIFVVLVIALVKPAFVEAVSNMLDETVLNKVNTPSGIERFAWNSMAWQDFLDTYGFGIGIGGARASSYPLILLSNAGLIGTLGFAVFVYKLFSRSNLHPATNSDLAIGTACRWAFAGSLISSTISAGVFELGTLPYLAAAGAAAIGYQEIGTTALQRVRLSRRPAQ